MKTLERRRFMASLGVGATAAFLAPATDRLIQEARGQDSSAKRIIFVTQGNGIRHQHYHREGLAPELDGMWTPLAAYQDQLLVVSEFYNPFDKALHGNQFATLSMLPSSNQEGEKRGPPGGISIDRVIARQIGQDDAFAELTQALQEGGKKPLFVSADGENQPVAPIVDPLEAYATYFGSEQMGMAPEFDPEQLLAQDQALLDFAREDIGRLRRRLAGSERQRLDSYLDSVERLEQQLSVLTQTRFNCQDIEAPAPGDKLENFERGRLDPDVIEAHFDVAANALKCGLSRVAHLSILGMEGPHDRYGWLGNDAGHHNAHHDGKHDQLMAIDTYTMGVLARLAEHLAQTPEGGGSMLDNSVIAYINTCGGKHHGGHERHFAFLIGSGGGFFKTGQFMSGADTTMFNGRKRSMSDLLVTLAHSVGVQLETFGDPEHFNGIVSEMLA